MSIYKTSIYSGDDSIPGYLLASNINKQWDLSGYNWQLRAPGIKNFLEAGIISSNAYDSVDNKLDETGWVDFDVTSYVKQVKNGKSNNGIGITMWPYSEEGLDKVWYMYHRYASSDYVKNTELRPKLEIVTLKDGVSIENTFDEEFKHNTAITFANGVITVLPENGMFNSGNIKVDIHSINGRVIHSIQEAQIDNGMVRVNFKDRITLPSGSYIVRVYDDNSSTALKMLVM